MNHRRKAYGRRALALIISLALAGCVGAKQEPQVANPAANPSSIPAVPPEGDVVVANQAPQSSHGAAEFFQRMELTRPPQLAARVSEAHHRVNLCLATRIGSAVTRPDQKTDGLAGAACFECDRDIEANAAAIHAADGKRFPNQTRADLVAGGRDYCQRVLASSIIRKRKAELQIKEPRLDTPPAPIPAEPAAPAEPVQPSDRKPDTTEAPEM